MFRNFISILFIFFNISFTFAQTKINSLDISGNDYLTANDISNLMASKNGGRYTPEQFQLDLKTIRDRYKNSGFLFVKFSEEKIDFNDDSSYVDIKLKINEGEKVTIGDIEITGNRVIPKNEILKNFVTKVGDNLNDNELNEDISGLLKNYESKGMPFAKIMIKDISVYKNNGADKIKISLDITENSKIKIEQVKIKGNETTKDYVILRELKLEDNKTVTSQTLQEIGQRLDKLNIFDYISEPKIYSLKNKDESGLLIEVKEGNTSTFDGILGYNPPQNTEGTSENGYLSGLVNISFRNLFGTGRRMDARYEQLVLETQELEFKYFEPYFFSLPFNIHFGFLQRIQDTSYTRRNLDLKGDFLFSDKFTISLVGGYERIIPSDIVNPSLIVADSRTLSSGIELRYDSRDNIFIPTKGYLYRTFYSYGSRKIYNVTNLQNYGYAEDFSIQKYWANLDFYFSFFKRQTLFLRLFGGEIKSDVFDNPDYFRVGGIKNIRGYRNEQFLASRFAYSNLELRYAVSRKSFLFAFYDSGYYYYPPDDINSVDEQSGLLYGYGMGIRLETGLGLIGVSYALSRDDSPLDGKINFGLITDF